MSDPCPTCGKPRGYLMETHPDKPGFMGLLRGEGEDSLMRDVAWAGLLFVVFVGVFLLSTLAFS